MVAVTQNHSKLSTAELTSSHVTANTQLLQQGKVRGMEMFFALTG